MHDGFRRLLTTAGIFGIALLAVYLLRRDGPGHFGMFELAAGDPLLESAETQPFLERLNSEFSNLTESVVPAVVSIDTRTTINVPEIVSGPFADSPARAGRYTQPGLGSGVIVSAAGHVITNHHVIAGVDEIEVTMSDGQRYFASVVGTDERSDIAVLRIQAEEGTQFPALSFADSDAAKVGHMVFAVGNPFGLSETVTRGIISAKQRYISEASPAVFQTDTVINPGNSGGPLVNIHGQIVGINVALYAGQKDVRVWQGVGLAIPSNEVSAAYTAIIENKSPRGYLGVRFEELVRARTVEGNVPAGVLIDAISPGSPAEEAGLKQGDVLLQLNEEDITSTAALMRKVKYATVGDTVAFTVMRDDAPAFTITATIGERPDELSAQVDPQQPTGADGGQSGTGIFEKTLGIHVRALTGYERRRIGMALTDPGILIAEIEPDSPVGDILRTQDIITHANIHPIRTPEELGEIFQKLPLDERPVLEFIRAGHTYIMPVVPKEK